MALCEIQALNTLGVELISEGDYDDALNVFSHAIHLLSEALDAPFQKALPPTTTTTASLHSGVCVRDVNLFGREPSIIKGDFFFNPFLFECPNVAASGSNTLHKQLSFAAITCLFNLGLCFQLEYVQRCPERDQLLTSSLHFYQEAFSLVLQDDSNATDYSEVIKTLMAVCTNASFCQAELGHIDQIQRWNGRLATILRFVPSSLSLTSNNDFSNSKSMIPPETSQLTPEDLRVLRMAEQEQWLTTCQYFSLNAYHFGFGFNAAKAA